LQSQQIARQARNKKVRPYWTSAPLRVHRPNNKETELHPLVRWQFQRGLKEDQRARVLVHQCRRCVGPSLRHSGGGLSTSASMAKPY
jgi:hypothetical protein